MKPDVGWVISPRGEKIKGDRWSGQSRPAGKSRTGPPAPCVCCGEWGPVMARGLRDECYHRWRKRGKLTRWPLTRRVPIVELERGFARERARQYEELRTGTGATSRERACIVLGISTRTAYRYEAWLRQQAQAGCGTDKEG